MYSLSFCLRSVIEWHVMCNEIFINYSPEKCQINLALRISQNSFSSQRQFYQKSSLNPKTLVLLGCYQHKNFLVSKIGSVGPYIWEAKSIWFSRDNEWAVDTWISLAVDFSIHYNWCIPTTTHSLPCKDEKKCLKALRNRKYFKSCLLLISYQLISYQSNFLNWSQETHRIVRLDKALSETRRPRSSTLSLVRPRSTTLSLVQCNWRLSIDS